MATVPLYHRDLGGTGKPPLLVLHGLLGSSRNWQTAGADLSSQYHVVALDLRNHGRSPHADEMTYSAMAADVLAWMDEHGLEGAALLGHSMGGKTAMRLACDHPDRVARLFVVDIAPKNYTWVANRASFAAMNELDLRDLRSRSEAEMRFEARVPSWPMRKFLTTNLEQAQTGEWRWTINLPAITEALSTLEGNSLADGDRYGGPTRFITGGRSDYVEDADHAAIQTHFPGVEVVVLSDSGHNPHMEARSAFVGAVLQPFGAA